MKVEMVGIGSLKPSAENTRQAEPKKSPDWDSFVQSIGTLGLQVPLIVRKVGEAAFEIVSGHRRYAAAKQLGLELVPCIVEEMDDFKAREVRVVENLQRKDLTPFEEAEQIAYLVDDGKSIAQIAEALGKSAGWVLRRANIAKIDKAIRKQINGWPASSLATLGLFSKEQQKELALRFQHHREGPSAGYLEELFMREMHMLRNAPWKMDTDVAGLPKCQDCKTRTKAAGDLFAGIDADIDKNDRCLNEECWKKKIKIAVVQQVEKAAKEEKALTLVTTEHHEPKKVCGYVAKKVYNVEEEPKPGYIQVISADTGKLAYVSKHELGGNKKENVGASGNKPVTKDMKEKREALDRRRVFPVIQAVKLAMLKSKIGETAIATDEHALLTLVAVYGTDGIAWNAEHRDAISAIYTKADNSGIRNIEDDLVSEAVWARLKGSLHQILNVNGAPKIHERTIVTAKKIAEFIRFDWERALAEQIEKQPEPKSWSKTEDEKKGSKKKSGGSKNSKAKKQEAKLKKI